MLPSNFRDKTKIKIKKHIQPASLNPLMYSFESKREEERKKKKRLSDSNLQARGQALPWLFPQLSIRGLWAQTLLLESSACPTGILCEHRSFNKLWFHLLTYDAGCGPHPPKELEGNKGLKMSHSVMELSKNNLKNSLKRNKNWFVSPKA